VKDGSSADHALTQHDSRRTLRPWLGGAGVSTPVSDGGTLDPIARERPYIHEFAAWVFRENWRNADTRPSERGYGFTCITAAVVLGENGMSTPG
jgi:hypothetical protein